MVIAKLMEQVNAKKLVNASVPLLTSREFLEQLRNADIERANEGEKMDVDQVQSGE